MRQLRLSLRAQLFLHARRHTFLLVLATAVLLLGGHSPSLIAGLQLRSSQQAPSPPFSASPPSSPAALFSAPAPPLVAHPGTDHAAAVTVPSLKSAAAAVRAVGDPNVPAATPGGVRGVPGSPAAAVPGSADALPTPAALNARRATVPAAAAGARARLAFVTTLPAASSRGRGQLQSNRATGRCSSWSSRCQQQRREAAAAANSDSQRGREQSWLRRPLLQNHRLAACPSGALVRRWTLSSTAASSFPSVRVPQQQQQQRQPQDGEGAVVEGEKVNGKSVREWTVERTLYQALHMALAEEMQRDPAVCVMGEDVGHYGGSYKVTKDLHAVFGNLRVMDTPICENTFTGMAIGAAMNGLRPVVEGMNMGFLLLAFNQISNNAGMVRYTSGGSFDVPVVIRGPGGVGKQLGPEHSQRIEAYLMAVPGLKMVACSTPYNARGLLKSAIREDNPVIFFEHVLTYNVKESIPLLPYTLPLDRAEVAREGSDVTVLAYGKLRYVALDAAKQLDSLGISTEVVDLVSLKPLDMDSICKSVRKTGRCVVLDESNKTGGIGGEILSQVVENCADELLRPPVRLATKDIPTPYARGLEDATIVTPTDVVNAALWMLSSRSQPAVARHVG